MSPGLIRRLFLPLALAVAALIEPAPEAAPIADAPPAPLVGRLRVTLLDERGQVVVLDRLPPDYMGRVVVDHTQGGDL